MKGHLADRWAAWFDGMTLTRQADGTTVLDGPVADQSALHGLLRKVSDLGLPARVRHPHRLSIDDDLKEHAMTTDTRTEHTDDDRRAGPAPPADGPHAGRSPSPAASPTSSRSPPRSRS